MLQWYQKLEWLSAEEVKLWFTDGYGRQQFLTWHKNQPAHCTCGSGSSQCVHIQLLSQTIDPEALTPNNTAEQTSANAQKQERRADRITKLERALDELSYWLEDILSRGLAAQIQEQPAFAEGVAVRMADASLTSLHRRLIELQTSTIQALQNNQPLPLAWADLLFLLRAGKQQHVLPDKLWNELCQTLGISIRKEEVRNANHRITDIFTVMGVEKLRLEPRLHQRTTWLYAHQHTSFHTIIEYEFEGTTWLPAALPICYRFEATAYAYPSVFLHRLIFHSIPEQPTTIEAPDIQSFKNLGEAIAHHSKQLTTLPWLTESAVVLQDVAICFHLGAWYLKDAAGLAMQIHADQAPTLLQLYAKTGGRHCRLFCVVQHQAIRVVSAWLA